MTGYLLDTSILIDLGNHRLDRHPRVRRWFEEMPADDLFTCTIAIGELARGVAALPDGPKRRQQSHYLQHTVLPAFRVLPFDLPAALYWGNLMGEGQRSGALPPSDDAKIAAIAAVNGLTVATGNVTDFARLGVPWLDPGRVPDH
ncbi:MAG: PIN domain-containing protein [Geminicoccaceae bacterium]